MKNILLKIILFYRRYLSRPGICRFVPSCSQYCYEAVEKYGTILGIFKCFGRILRCHPWNKGGEDPLL